jgi:hypothetical protein
VEGDCGVPFDNAPLDAPFEVVPFAVPFDDVAFDLVPFGVPFDTNAFAVPFVTAIFNVGQKLSLYNVSQLQIESCGTRGLSKSRRRFAIDGEASFRFCPPTYTAMGSRTRTCAFLTLFSFRVVLSWCFRSGVWGTEAVTFPPRQTTPTSYTMLRFKSVGSFWLGTKRTMKHFPS